MRRVLLATVLLALVAPSAHAGVTSTERKLVRKLSEVRERQGLSPLRDDRTLHRSAGRYSRWQVKHGYFGHQPQIRMSSRYGLRGEVLRLSYSGGVSVRQTVRLWMHSPAHRYAILQRGMRFAGAGVETGRFRGRRATVVTVHLGGR